MDIKSIIYFFRNLNIKRNKNIWNKIISNEYERLSEMKLEDLKNNLRKLKYNKIYDYERKNENYKFFTCLYDKKKAIEFLLTKTDEDINELYNRIDTKNKKIAIKNIQDTKECIKIFNKFKQINDNFGILEYIKTLTPDEISKFELFSKNYSSFIELEK